MTTDSEALTEARVRRILAEIDETAPANDGPGAVSAFYTSLSFTEVRGLCTLALSALGTAPAVPPVAWWVQASGETVPFSNHDIFVIEGDAVTYAAKQQYNLQINPLYASPAPATAAEIRAGALREAATIAAEFPNMGEYSGREIAARLRALSEGSAK